MVFKNLRFQLVLRISLILICIFISCWLFISLKFWYASIFFLIIVAIQSFEVIRYLEASQRDIINLLGFIQYDDFTVTYPALKHSGAMRQLYEEYNKVIIKFRELRNEKESNLHFFQSALQHIDIGILAFNKSGEIKIVNTSALKLIEMPAIDHLSKLKILHPEMYSTFWILPSHQKLVLNISKSTGLAAISVSVVEVVIVGEEFRLVSLQNIQTELEEKEMEAWQNMTKVMMHEIMNSLTPITSLAATASDEIQEWHNKNFFKDVFSENMNELHQAINTIKTRSEGLLHFVEDFRSLSQIPRPQPELFSLKKFFDHILLLMKANLIKHNTDIDIELKPDNLQLMADFHLIEQVLINLINNSLEALLIVEHTKKINISAFYNSQSQIEIIINDNAEGMDEEVLRKVFIPFYSTKKTGSGIGLTISKQIMRLHHGTIMLQSEKEKGTSVRLIFN